MTQTLQEQFQEEAEIFKALAHPTRLFVIHTVKEKHLSVQELADQVGVDISTMSKHLDVLKKQKIIIGEKENNKVFYSLNIPCVLDFMSCAYKVRSKQ